MNAPLAALAWLAIALSVFNLVVIFQVLRSLRLGRERMDVLSQRIDLLVQANRSACPRDKRAESDDSLLNIPCGRHLHQIEHAGHLYKSEHTGRDLWCVGWIGDVRGDVPGVRAAFERVRPNFTEEGPGELETPL